MKRRTRNIVWSLLMILALLAAPLKVTAAEQNGESSDKQQNETTEQKTEETEETAPEITTDLGLASPSVLLMEAQTGTVLYEKNASEQRSPASITKIMTLLLILKSSKRDAPADRRSDDECARQKYGRVPGFSGRGRKADR